MPTGPPPGRGGSGTRRSRRRRPRRSIPRTTCRSAGRRAGAAVAFAPGDSLRVGGMFLGNMGVGATTLECKGAIDGFVAKLDPAGSPVWSAAFGDARGVQAAYGVASGPAGEIVICGSASGTTDFGTGPLTAAGGSDAFIAELDR